MRDYLKEILKYNKGKQEMINWFTKRMTERTTLDGVILIATGIAMILVPVDLIAYAAIFYGAWTIWKAE